MPYMATGGEVAMRQEEFKFGSWVIKTVKGSILKSSVAEEVTKALDIPQIPEMTFGDNCICLSHSNGFAIEFKAIDALKLVDNKNDLVKVAVAREWIESRKNCEYINHTVKPFDWTFSTTYKGTVYGEPENVKIEETHERIDIERLKVREKIAFFSQIVLFEDELADHGCAELCVKIRVMPSCFFLLMRYFLRVDDLLTRIHDTRLFHEAGKNYLLREYTEKELPLQGTTQIPSSSLTDSYSIDSYLIKKREKLHKMIIQTQNPNVHLPAATLASFESESTVTSHSGTDTFE